MSVPPPPPPRPTGSGEPWLAALAVLGVLLAAVLVLTLAVGTPWQGGGAQAPTTATGPTATPTTTTSPSPTPPTPAASPTATATGAPSSTPTARPSRTPLDGPRPEGIDELAAQVAELRALPLDAPPDARVVPPARLGERFAELALEEYDSRQLALDGRLLTALRLLQPGDDLVAILEGFYREQVLGVYVPEEGVLYVGGEESRLSPAQRITAAHEILHLLQDRAFDLQRFAELDDRDTDAQLAALALVEGDAVLGQQLWSLRHQSVAEREQALDESAALPSDALATAPRYVRETLLFPYREGVAFVGALFEDGGWAAVDAAFADPPRSTRHVLRPDTYLAGERHSEVTITATPGGGWRLASAYTFGEFDTRQWFAPLGEAGAQVAAGWDGGLTHHWHDGDADAVALTLRLATPETAAQACDAVPAWYAEVAGGETQPDERGTGDAPEAGAGGTEVARGDRDWLAWTCGDAEVRVGLAPDAATARRLVQG